MTFLAVCAEAPASWSFIVHSLNGCNNLQVLSSLSQSSSAIKRERRDISVYISILITQGLNPFYAVRIFDSYVKSRVKYCMTVWFHQNMTSLDKMWWSVHKSIFGIRNYQVSKHVVRVLVLH